MLAPALAPVRRWMVARTRSQAEPFIPPPEKKTMVGLCLATTWKAIRRPPTSSIRRGVDAGSGMAVGALLVVACVGRATAAARPAAAAAMPWS
ncbi:MAG: hypothetical protein EOO38_03240 [Cytophagaceae bacterium]|nr:MAG: hypothetical protein EOO38_03240 [Cytophagaceae bacterium]